MPALRRRGAVLAVAGAARLLIALALLSETGGRAVIRLAGSGTVPVWVATLLHLVAAGLLAAGLLRLAAALPDRSARIRTTIDSAGVAVSAGVVVWIAGPMSLATSAPTVVHAVADVVIVTGALAVLARTSCADGAPLRAVLPVGLAGVVLAGGDVAGLRNPVVADLLLVVAVALVVAALSRAACDGDPSGMPRRERVAVTAAAAPVAGAVIAVAMARVAGHPAPVGVVAAMVVLAALLLARLTTALLDALSLARTLETQVAERTHSLVAREQWFRALVQNASDVVTVVDPDGTIRYLSPAMERVFGYDPTLLIGTKLSVLLRPTDARRLDSTLAEAAHHPRSAYVLEFAMWHRDGRWSETETIVTSLVDDPDINGLVLNTRDVSDRKQLQARLAHQAYHDALTGLANRTLFHQRLAAALADGDARMDNGVAVLFCDLDGFKAVNDVQGHDAGDVLLTLVADRLRHCVRPGDVVARFGGDEFAVLVVDPDARAAASEVAERLTRSVGKPYSFDGREVRVGVSVGVAISGAGARSPELLLRNADLAMYRAKADRSLSVVLFEPAMHDALLARLEVEDDLREALGRGELVLHYQPTVDLTTGRICGVEALMRWSHPERGLVSPEEFIAVAEESGYIDAMGEWALFEACRHGARWQRHAGSDDVFVVAVNISGRQVGPKLVEVVRAALEETGLPPSALLLEMTETVLMQRTQEAIRVLREVKELGVRVAVDDFGTGYSSLSYLSKFPVDVLKIDKHFVEAVAGDSERAELARTIVNLGRTLRLVTVAEGIETAEQCGAMRTMGCDLGQGYLFSAPVPAIDMSDVLADVALTAARLGLVGGEPLPAARVADDELHRVEVPV